MRVWGIIPVKELEEAKSRLAGVLLPAERAALSRRLLLNTIRVLSGIAEIEQVIVVSRDPEVLDLAAAHGARAEPEEGPPGLNPALSQAARRMPVSDESGLLVVPADLPLLAEVDIRRLLADAGRPPIVALAPDRHGQGTNALLVAPAGLIEYAFGEGSFSEHQARARAAGARILICHRLGFSLDLDGPDDLQLLREHSRTTSLAFDWSPS